MKNFQYIFYILLLLNCFLIYPESPKTIYFEEHVIDDSANTKAVLKVIETPNNFIISIANPPYFFHNAKDTTYTVTSDGWGVIVEGNKRYREIGNFTLPTPAALSVRRQKIEPQTIAENTIAITIPKDITKSRLYYWWYRKKFQRFDPWAF